jgi:hypothetical protein
VKSASPKVEDARQSTRQDHDYRQDTEEETREPRKSQDGTLPAAPLGNPFGRLRLVEVLFAHEVAL